MAVEPAGNRKDLGTIIHDKFKDVGNTDDLKPYPRERPMIPPDFADW